MRHAVRDISPKQFEELIGKSGIGNDTTVVIYGDNNNWFAAWAFWQLKIYGHDDVRIMNGGRKKWLAESRELTTDRRRTGHDLPRDRTRSVAARVPAGGPGGGGQRRAAW